MTALFNREKEKIMETKEINLWEVMPAIALRGLTIFPNMIIHFDVSRQKSIIAVEQAMMQDQKLFLVVQKDIAVEDPIQDDVYKIGTIATVKQDSSTYAVCSRSDSFKESGTRPSSKKACSEKPPSTATTRRKRHMRAGSHAPV